MGFSLDEYMKQNQKEANPASAAASPPSSFSLDSYISRKHSRDSDVNAWYREVKKTIQDASNKLSRNRYIYQSKEDSENYKQQYDSLVDDLIRKGLEARRWYTENAEAYDAARGSGKADSIAGDITQAIGALDKLRSGLYQEQLYRSQFADEKAFQDFLISSGDKEASDAVMSEYRQRISGLDQQITELEQTLNEKSKDDTWYQKLQYDLAPDWMLESLANTFPDYYGEEMERRPLKKQLKDLQDQREALQAKYANYFYTTDNRDKLSSIQNNTSIENLYSSAQELQEDMNKVSAVASDAMSHNGGSEIQEYRDYLEEKYGLTQEAITAYITGGSGYNYTENGYGNLWQLYEDLEKRLNDTKKSLSKIGYNYDRIAGYEQTLRDAEEYRKTIAELEKYADEHPIASSISSVLMSPFQGLDYLRQGINNFGKNDTNDLENYVPLNVYNMEATNFVSTIRDTVSQKIEENTDWEIFGQNVASFLYQTGMSVADSAAQVAAFGSGAVWLMGASAASNQAKNIIERGGTNRQAFIGGLAAGAAEALFEKVSIDRLLKSKSINGWKSLLKETTKQAGVEASEEMFTEIANILSDCAIMGESSEFAVAVKNYETQGLNEDEAKKRAFLDCVGQVAQAGAAGFLSGLFMGGGAGAAQYATYTSNTHRLGNHLLQSGGAEAVIREGLGLEAGDPLYKAAENLAAQQAEGAELSPRLVGQLAMELDNRVSGPEDKSTSSSPFRRGIEALKGRLQASQDIQVNPETISQNSHLNADNRQVYETRQRQAPESGAAQPLNAPARLIKNGDTTRANQTDSASVQGIVQVRDGEVTIRLNDGSAVPLHQVEIADPQIQQLYDTASKYDTDTAKAFVSGFDGSLPITTYQSAFDYFTTQAKSGVPIEEAVRYAGLAGRMMSSTSIQNAYFAGENQLKTNGRNGTIKKNQGGAANENSDRGYHRVGTDQGLSRDRAPGQSGGGYGNRNVSELGEAENGNPNTGESVLRRTQSSKRAFGQDQGFSREFLGKSLGRGESNKTGRTNPQGNRTSTSERAEERAGKQRVTRKNAARIERTSIETPGGTAEFEAVREDALTEKQRKETAIARRYGRELYHVPQGSLMTLGGKQRIMKAIAFVAPGTHTIFCRDGTNVEFIHHELFHDFLSDQHPIEKQLMNDVLTEVNLQSDAYDFYRVSCESAYANASIDDIIEEITADLCEYAMSGSRKMFDRLNGLFEGDALETLAEQAREVFRANRQDVQKIKRDSFPRFYLEDTVEESRDLIAVHNLSPQKLESAFDLGGFPMPSIAVTKADMGYEEFGDISLIFDKESIDPADKRNKVYSGDAWTPTFPVIEYEVNSEAARKFENHIADLSSKVAGGMFHSSSILRSLGIDDTSSMNPDQLAEKLAVEDSVSAAYLAEHGETLEPVMKEKEKQYDGFGNEALLLLVDDVGEQALASMVVRTIDGTGLTESDMESVRMAIQKSMKMRGGLANTPQKIERRLSHLTEQRVGAFIQNAWDFYRSGGLSDEREADFQATREALRSAVVKEKVIQWVKGELKDVLGKKGIRNKKDPFTPSGNRRSFDALHDEYTIENIVESMKGDAEKGGALFAGPGTIAAASTREYSSIEEIRGDRERLQRLSAEEQDKVKSGFERRLSDIVAKMTANSKSENIFSEISYAADAITEALTKRKTASGVLNELKRWKRFTVNEEIVSEIMQLARDMAETPTSYFEAKPQRAVDLDEIKAAIVPDTLSQSLKSQLKAAGIRTMEYKSGDSSDRVRALNAMPELRFYLEDLSPVDADLLVEENQALRDQVETLRQEFQLTKGHRLKSSAVDGLAADILRKTSSSYDKDTLAQNLETLFRYISDDPEANFDEAMQVSAELANSVLRQSSRLDTTLYDQYADMRRYFRQTPISLSEDVRSGMDYQQFRKEQFGGMRLTDKGASLDSLWGEISGMWPEFFDPDTLPQEQPGAVADALRTVRPEYRNPYGMNAAEAAYDLALEIYEAYFRIPEVHTFADRKQAELERLRAKYENRIVRIRQAYRQKETSLIQEQRQKRQDLKEENRLRLSAQLEKVRQQRMAADAKRRESALIRRYKPRIIRDVTELGRWLTHPTDQKHVPEPLREAVAEFLRSIDFSSDRLNSKGKPTMRTMALQKLWNQMDLIINSRTGNYSDLQAVLNDADPDLLPNIADLIQNAEKVRLEEMSGAQLEELGHVTAALKAMLTKADKLLAGERARSAERVAESIHLDLMSRRNVKELTGLPGLARRLLNYDMLDAPSFFEEIGNAAYQELYQPLRDSFDQKIRNTAQAVTYMQQVMKGLDTESWSGKKAEKRTFRLSGGSLSLTPAQIMSLYELSKREQARGHILGGGVRPSDTVKGVRIDKSFRPIRLTAEELAKIVGTLTQEQKEVADRITAFFQTTAEWGNQVSLKLYGYRKFTEDHYFPIVSDKNYIATIQGDIHHPEALLKNLGMTKTTVTGANNPIMVEDIFDVFTRQADQMGSYNAFVLPLADMNRVLNHKVVLPGGEVQGSLKESLERTMGHDAVVYWNRLVEDINGSARQDPPTIGEKLLSNMKAAAVGANLRVVIQQPTAYLRAAAMIDPKYLAKGLVMKSNSDEMNRYAPIAYWKDLGFFEMDTSRGMRDILMSREGLRDKAMKPAGWADTATWGKLWNAVKAEIQDTTDLKPGSVAFLEAAGRRFSEIIDRTQVVDSVLHRSQIMRSKNYINKTVTSFMSEPTKSYNLLRSAAREVQKNGWKKGGDRLVRSSMAFTASSIATALLAAVVDVLRDDDDEKAWVDKYLSAAGENILDNLNPLNMLPYAKDLASLLSGYSLTRQEMAGITDVVNAGRKWVSYFEGNSPYSVAWLIKNSAAGISKLTGIPLSSVLRDLEALVNGGIQLLGQAGVPVIGLEYTLDTFSYPANNRNAARYTLHLYNALEAGDRKLAQKIRKDMTDGGIGDDKIGYHIRKYLKEKEKRIAQAGKAKSTGDLSEYAHIVSQLTEQGFEQEWVTSAVDSWIRQADAASGDDSLSEQDNEAHSTEEPLFETADIAAALDAGKVEEARMAVDDLLTSGKNASAIRAALTRIYKPVYQDLYRSKDSQRMREIRTKLAGLGLGYKAEDFTNWIKDMQK